MRRTPTLRRATAALVLPLALTAVSACGADDPDTAETSESTEEAPGDEAGEEITPAEFVDAFEAGFEDATTAHMEMAVDGQYAMTAEGDVDYSTTPPSMAMTMQNEMLGENDTELILVDGVMYMAMGDMGGGKYLKMDLNDPNNTLGEDITSQMDPRKAFESMEKAISKVTFVGEEDVEGEEMKHYSLVIDPAKMSEAGTGPVPGMPEEIAYDVWLDDESLFRKAVMDLGEEMGTMTMTVSEWGEDVEIEAPPADEVTDMPSMPTMPSASPSS